MCRLWRWGRTQERGYSEAERCFLGVASARGRGRACLCLCAFIYDLKFELFTTSKNVPSWPERERTGRTERERGGER